MSVNVKTANGLLEIGGKVTKEKVISALGYSPANKEVETTVDNHIKDNTSHITSEERTAWDNKSDFSGDYNDLENAPVQEDESGEVIYADESGNIIAKFDSDGLSTTNVNTKSLNLNGEDLDSRLNSLESKSVDNIVENESGDFVLADEDGNVIMKVDAEGMHSTEAELDGIKVRETLVEHNNHVGDTEIHVTAEEKLAWDNKSGFSGDYNDLTNAPVQEDESGEVVYADEDGNVIAKIGQAGLETTQVTAKSVVVNGTDVGSHVGDEDIHVTAAEKAAWTNKESFSGDFNDLKNSPIQEDETGELVYADMSGNVIVKVNKDGLETTHVAVDAIVLKDVINGNTYMLQMQNGKLVSFSIALSIQITVPPAKSLYSEGEEFDPAGMVVSAICEDGSMREIINYTYSVDNNIVTILYREWKSRHTTTFEIIRYILEDLLIDFEYTSNDDNTYTITNWKETLNGEPSTEMVIPDIESVIL